LSVFSQALIDGVEGVAFENVVARRRFEKAALWGLARKRGRTLAGRQQAARVILAAWRAHKRKLFLHGAARVIQRWHRRRLLKKVLEKSKRSAARRLRREAKAKAASAADADASAGNTRGDGDGGGGEAPVFASLEDQLRAMMIKRNDGGKLTGKERKMLAKAEKEGRLPSLEPPEDGGPSGASREGPLSAPESWARALEAVSVHVRGGGGNDDDDDDANATDAVVDVSGMDVSVRGVRLFEDASFKIARGRKVALLGANGSGKSTLVRLIASGRIRARVHDVACVAQELEAGERSALDALVSCDSKIDALLREESALIDAMEAAENATENAWDDAKWRDASARLGALAEELERRDAYASEAKARRILAGLGFSDEDMSGPLSKLSGGWRMRAALAQAQAQHIWLLRKARDRHVHHVVDARLSGMANCARLFACH